MAGRICTDCQATLSRYNQGTTCRLCTGKRPRESPAWAVDTPAFRAAVASGRPGAALAAIRTAARLSQTEFADLLGWEPSTYTRAERGQTGTLYDVRELQRIASVLAIPGHALAPLLTGQLDSKPGMANALNAKGIEESSEMRRRTLGQAALGVAATWAAAPINAIAATGQQQIGLPQVAYLRGAVERFNSANQQFGAAATLKPAFAAYQHARGLLENGNYSEAVGVSLAAAVADLAGCAGWQAYDSNMQQLARQCYNEALVLAEQSEEAGLAIRLLGNMTRQACHLSRERPGLAREAVRFSQRAFDHSRARPMSSSMRAHVGTLEMIAQAAIGDAVAFERALAQTWREVDRGLECGDSDPVWFAHYLTVAEVQANEAKGRRLLRQHAQADNVLRGIVSEDTSEPLYGLLYRINLATNSAARTDTTDALTHGLVALTALENTVKSPRLLGELRPVREAARVVKRGRAAEFASRYDKLAAAA